MKPKFLSKLQTELIGERLWRVTADLSYHAASGKVYIVPAGFVTDGGSIPRVCWALIGPPMGDISWSSPFVLHDWLYATGQESRDVCDGLLYESGRASGGWWMKAQTIYWAVRAAGWAFYKEAKRALKAFARSFGGVQ